MSDVAFLQAIARIYQAARASEDGTRCMVAPHPALRERIKSTMRAMTLTAGTFAAGTLTNISVSGNWTNNAGASAFTPGPGTVAFNGAEARLGGAGGSGSPPGNPGTAGTGQGGVG